MSILDASSDLGDAILEQELSAVRLVLQHSLDGLIPPLRDMVDMHIKWLGPQLRAAAVLTADAFEHESAQQRERRIHLAAALEMLAIALSIHKVLLGASATTRSDDDNRNASNGDETHEPSAADTATGTAADTIDKSLLGSVILAGDYCFSRAAALATQTDSPRVIELFANALKTVSEGHLRRLFAPSLAVYDEDRALCLAGVSAALELSGQSVDAAESAAQYADCLLLQRRLAPTMPAALEKNARRWHGFEHWLNAEH